MSRNCDVTFALRASFDERSEWWENVRAKGYGTDPLVLASPLACRLLVTFHVIPNWRACCQASLIWKTVHVSNATNKSDDIFQIWHGIAGHFSLPLLLFLTNASFNYLRQATGITHSLFSLAWAFRYAQDLPFAALTKFVSKVWQGWTKVLFTLLNNKSHQKCSPSVPLFLSLSAGLHSTSLSGHAWTWWCH